MFAASTASSAGATERRRHSRWWWGIPVMVVLIGIVGAISLNHPSTDPARAVGTGYLATETGTVVFMQWNVSGNNNMSGSAQVETLSGTPPNASVQTSTVSVNGSMNGDTITFSFDGGADVFGTLSGESFTVNFPQQDGSLAPTTFTSATAEQFNEALSNLQGNTGSANQRAAQAQAIAQQHAQQQSAIASAAQQVNEDLSGLSSDVSSLNNDLGDFGPSLTQAQNDLATTAAQEQTVQNEASNETSNDQVCSDADTAASDADTVASDGDTVSSDADSVENDLSTVRQDIRTVKSDFSSFQSAQSQQPSYRADGSPTSDRVNQAVGAANAGIAQAVNTANADIGQVNSDQTQAYNDAAAAASVGGCAGPAAPTAQPTIS
jgi:hypothetical protein